MKLRYSTHLKINLGPVPNGNLTPNPHFHDIMPLCCEACFRVVHQKCTLRAYIGRKGGALTSTLSKPYMTNGVPYGLNGLHGHAYAVAIVSPQVHERCAI